MSDMSLQERDEIAHRMAASWLRFRRLASDFDTTIDPRDEMFSLMRNSRDYRPGSERFEYLRTGDEIRASLLNVVGAMGHHLSDCRRVLEFACGFGRFTRYLVHEVSATKVDVSDIVPDAVDFVTRTFGVQGILSRIDPDGFDPRSRYGIIFVSSLFSHLPRSRFHGWLTRLLDLLDDFGLLVFSTHGEDVVQQIPKDPSGFTFVASSESAVLDTSEYGSTFVRPSVVRAMLQEVGIENIYGLEKELWGFQDLWVASRYPIASLENWRQTAFVRGRIDQVNLGRDGEFMIEGWAADTRAGSPLRRVTIAVDDVDIGEAVLGGIREDVAQAAHRASFDRSGWSLHGKARSIAPGVHVLCARGESKESAATIFDMLAYRVG